jgi:murein L,D-transpeptidase YcbB/YkuD
MKPEAPAAAAPKPVAPVDAAAATPAAAETTNSTPATSTDGVKFNTASVSADAAIVDKLREQLASGKFDRILGGKKERVTVEAFYASRDFAPLWIADGAITDRAKAAAAYLASVDADGLDPSEYPIPQIKAGMEPDALAEAEIKFTDSVLTFARHAMAGRVHYSRVAADIVYDLAKPDPANVLARIAKAQDAGAALDSLNPPQPQYKALKAKLAEMRKGADDIAKPMIAQGPVLKYSKDKKGKEVLMEDPRVPVLRERFGLKSPDGDTTYDKALSETIAKFQKENGINANGQLNAATLEVINGPRREKTVDIIVANMERWRWMPRDLGHTYVMVNIPDFTLRVVRNDKLVWKTKVVVGKPTLPTPLLSAEMKFITVNPTWNVPPSIITTNICRRCSRTRRRWSGSASRSSRTATAPIRIYQPPGDKNALGRIRFNFPNKFLVYQHDTPDKHLFAHDKRAYSHGCMRVENPLKYGEVLLGLALPNEHYTADRLQKMFGGSEVNINFPTGIPDHLTYQTAFVDDDGKLCRSATTCTAATSACSPSSRVPSARWRTAPSTGRRARHRPRSGCRPAPSAAPADNGFGNGSSTPVRRQPEPAPKPRARVGANERGVTPR